MRLGAAFVLGLALACANAAAQDAGGKPFAPEQINEGAELFATHCSTCHGNRRAKPEWAPVDLRKIPREDHARFIATVTYAIRNMPPCGDVLQPGGIVTLWAHVVAGAAQK